LIPNAYIQAWRASAPWPDARQIEQDLVICRALCDLFNAPALKGKIAFRGGTAINKLLFKRSLRYSEDIDLVQTTPEPIGATVNAVRDALSWLGKCKREHAGHSMHVIFKFTPETDTQSALKLKVEINTREHQSALGIKGYPFAVDNGGIRAMPKSRLSRRRKCSAQSCALCCSGTRIAISSIYFTDSSNSRWIRAGSSPVSITTSRLKGGPLHAQWRGENGHA
jgi:hypothetical protein